MVKRVKNSAESQTERYTVPRPLGKPFKWYERRHLERVNIHRTATYMTAVKNVCKYVVICDIIRILKQQKHGGIAERYSEQWLIDRADPSASRGVVTLRTVLRHVRVGGLPLKEDYPRVGPSLPKYKRPQNLILHRPILNYHKLDPNNEQQIIKYLKQAPLIAAVVVGAEIGTLEPYAIYELPKPGEKRVCHAMIITGTGKIRGKASKNRQAKPYWEMKNNYGKEIGDDGYCRVRRSSKHNPILEVFRVFVS